MCSHEKFMYPLHYLADFAISKPELNMYVKSKYVNLFLLQLFIVTDYIVFWLLDRVCFVHPDEWKVIKELFEVDIEIEIKGDGSGPPIYSPGIVYFIFV